MSVGETLKKIREKSGLTQEQFADRIGVKRTTYISYETSKTNPEFVLVAKIAEMFGVELQDFFDEEKHSGKILELNSQEIKYQTDVDESFPGLSSDEVLLVKYFRSLEKDEKTDFFEEIKNDYLDRKCGLKFE